MRRLAHIPACGLLAAAVCLAAVGARAEDGPLFLSEAGWWRQWVRFGPDRVSGTLLKGEGDRLLGAAAMQRLKNNTESGLRRAGVDPSGVDWREHVLVRFLFDPYQTFRTPALSDGWEARDFDDGAWVLRRGLFAGGGAAGRTVPKLGGWTKDDVDQGAFENLGVQGCCYRGRFVVDDPAKAGAMTLRLAYHGGVRAFVNGKEIARGHLPAGELAPDVPADDYPIDAYQKGIELRDRVLGPVRVPAALLVQGVNVLAVELRASSLHPVILKLKLAVNDHKIRQDRQGMWPHACLSKVELRGTSAAPRAKSLAAFQVWVTDIHHRVASDDPPPPGEGPGVLRIVGAPNGTFAAQLAVRSSVKLRGFALRGDVLKREGGTETIPDSALHVSYPAPYPEKDFSESRLGDERGLDATFPDARTLERCERMEGTKGPWIFDRLVEKPPETFPANCTRPVWLSLRIPADATPGRYHGAVDVHATGGTGIPLEVRLDVADWRLPDPKDFRTFVGCEENPYGVARQYGVKPWSEGHWRLLEASFRQLGRVGSDWLNVPVISRTEFGNRDDSMVLWTRRRDGSLSFDYVLLDRYVDLAARECGRPQVINFVVMQGMKSTVTPPAAAKVRVFDEASGKTAALALGGGITAAEKEKRWGAFATSLYEHMKARGLADVMYWGFPLEGEDDPELKTLLERFVPKVFWAAGPHETLWNATYANDRHYRVLATVRYQPGDRRSLGTYRVDEGWKSALVRVLEPRVGGNFLAMHTVSFPFAYRVLPELALARGHRGFGRIGADEWAAAHYQGMDPVTWITGMPVLFVLWPGVDGAESSQRFEVLLEGIQETEARIFIEQALDGARLPAGLAKRAREVLARRLYETAFIEGALCVHELEQYTTGWQDRSRALYETAAEVRRAVGQ